MTIESLIAAAAVAPTPEVAESLYRLIQGESTRQAIVSCTRCPLHETSTQRVPWRGHPSPVAIIGEAPGASEDRDGAPFVGQAGRILSRVLASVNVAESDVAFVNTICCRPPRNNYADAHTVGAVKACSSHFTAQLAYLGSWVLVVMGNNALRKFLPDASISSERGRPRWIDQFYVIPTYHPAYALRKPGITQYIAQDLSILRPILIGNREVPPPPSPVPAVEFMRQSPAVGLDAAHIEKLFRKHGYVVVHSRRLGEDVVVTRDSEVVPEAKFYHLPRYTLGEVARLSKVGSEAHLRQVHILKRELGVEVLV